MATRLKRAYSILVGPDAVTLRMRTEDGESVELRLSVIEALRLAENVSQAAAKAPPEAKRVRAGSEDSISARRPWKSLGMSRATWYRLNKPAEKPLRAKTQAEMARELGVTLRTVQRRIRRQGATQDPAGRT